MTNGILFGNPEQSKSPGSQNDPLARPIRQLIFLNVIFTQILQFPYIS